MGQVRPLHEYDIPAVADLFTRVFRPGTTSRSPDLEETIRDVYLGNPWRQDDLPSYVHLNAEGMITGFIGSLPRPMRFRAKEVRAVVPGNHMVDPLQRDPLAGIMLLRKLLGGPQDLTITDTANDVSRELWTRMGARYLPGLSTRWMRVLRPASFALQHTRMGGIPSAHGLRHATRMADGVLGPLITPDLRLLPQALRERPFESTVLHRHLARFAGSRGLRPVYGEGDARWLIERALRKTQYGELHGSLLFEGEELVGWYMFYGRTGGRAEVLQMVGDSRRRGAVLRHMMERARSVGCTGILGALDPEDRALYRAHLCIPFQRASVTMAHSRNQEILAALEGNDVFFSRLEGEWWTRLQGDTFTPQPSR